VSATAEFYLARAAQDAQAAEQTDLANVRERCLRSEAVWRNMAARQDQIEKKQKRDALDKAARIAETPINLPWPVTPTPRQRKMNE